MVNEAFQKLRDMQVELEASIAADEIEEREGIPSPYNDDIEANYDEGDPDAWMCSLCDKWAEAGRTCDSCHDWVCMDCGLSKVHWPCPKPDDA